MYTAKPTRWTPTCNQVLVFLGFFSPLEFTRSFGGIQSLPFPEIFAWIGEEGTPRYEKSAFHGVGVLPPKGLAYRSYPGAHVDLSAETGDWLIPK